MFVRVVVKVPFCVRECAYACVCMCTYDCEGVPVCLGEYLRVRVCVRTCDRVCARLNVLCVRVC